MVILLESDLSEVASCAASVKLGDLISVDILVCAVDTEASGSAMSALRPLVAFEVDGLQHWVRNAMEVMGGGAVGAWDNEAGETEYEVPDEDKEMHEVLQRANGSTVLRNMLLSIAG